MSYYRNMLLSAVCILLIVTGCKKAPLENPFYRPYLKRVKSADHTTMLQILDTMTLLFQQEPPGLKDKAYYYKQKSVYYENMGNFASSLRVLDSLRTILSSFEKSDLFYRQEYPAMLLALAKNYTELKLFDEAITLLMTAQEFIENNVSNGCVRASYLDKIAQMMIVHGHSRMAIAYLLQSHKESQLCTKSFERFYYGYNSLTKISTCYLAMDMYDSAQYYCDTALRYVVSNEPQFPERSDYFVLCKAIINGNIASIKANFAQYDEAERLLRSTIKETAAIYPQYSLLCQLSLLRIYLNADLLTPAKALSIQLTLLLAGGKHFYRPTKKTD